MTLFLLIVYVISVGLVLVSPESTLPPDAGQRLRQRFATLLGSSAAGFALLVCVSVVMSVFFSLSKTGYAILGIIGSMYICYRGLVAAAAVLLPQPATQPTPLAGNSFTSGFLNTLRNQRVVGYFVSLLPIFVAHGNHFYHNLMLLLVIWIILDLILRFAYNGAARQVISVRYQPALLISISIVFVLVALYGFTHYLSFLLGP